jgi:UrcA family protein
MKTVRKLVSTLLIGGAALTLSTHSFATETTVTYGADGRPSTTISVRDLDLGKPNDVQELYRRVQQGATAVCESELRTTRLARGPVPFDWRRQCFRSAVDEAVRSVGSERLTALHRGEPELIAGRK